MLLLRKYPALPTRSTECKAFGHKCSNCGKTNHSETVCKSKPPPRPVTVVCSASTHGANKHHTLDHHIFNSKWEKRQSPTRRLVDYIKLRLPQRPRGAVINIDGMADTGCQSCLVGTHILQKLGISKADLIPEDARRRGIRILGAEFKLRASRWFM